MKFWSIISAVFLYSSILFGQINQGAAFLSFGRGFDNMGYDYNPSANREGLKITGNTITIELWLFPLVLPDPGKEFPLVTYTFQNYYPGNIYQLALVNDALENDPSLRFTVWESIWAEGISVEVQNTILAEPIEVEAWCYIAATYDGSKLRLFVNGQKVIEKDHIGSLVSIEEETYLALGGVFSTPGATNYFQYYYCGLIDELSIWSTARSEPEIAGDMLEIDWSNEASLTGFWKFDSYYSIERYPQVFASVTPDLTENKNDLAGWDPSIFVKSNASDPPYGTTYISTEVSSVDFGSTTIGGGAGPDTLKIYNQGNAPAFGFIELDSPDLQFPLHRMIPYFINAKQDNGPAPVFNESIYVIANDRGLLNGDLVLTGNAGNLPLYISAAATSTVPNYIIDANRVALWAQANGIIGKGGPVYDPLGFMWPLGSGKYMIYSSGLWLGAYTGSNQDELKITISDFGFAGGDDLSNFISGPFGAAEPSAEEHHSYKIVFGDDKGNPDYLNWPAKGWNKTNAWGAPLDASDKPWIPGNNTNNQTLFTIYNDQANPEKALGAEIQQTVFAFNTEDARKDAVFVRYKLINKSGFAWKNTYLGLFCDADLGRYTDDLAMVDTERDLAIMYNAAEPDPVYQPDFPALGYKILRGALGSKPSQAFAYFSYNLPDEYSDPDMAPQYYNYLKGLTKYGNDFPENWIDDQPGDKRFVISTGPFDLAANSTKEFLVALIAASGADNLSSVESLKNKADEIQALFENGEILGAALENLTAIEINPGETGVLDDRENSGAVFEIPMTNATETTTVEVAAYLGAPPGAAYIEHSGFYGIGKYIDVQMTNQNDVDWPIYIKFYYTEDDLISAGKEENELAGIYYWDGLQEEWLKYNDTGVNTTDEGNFAGYVWANADHLTAMCMGTNFDPALQLPVIASSSKPASYILCQNFPNPFNPNTRISFYLPNPEKVKIQIFNTLGQKIKLLTDQSFTTGQHQVSWDGTDNNGTAVPSGLYLYTIQCDGFVASRKMILIR